MIDLASLSQLEEVLLVSSALINPNEKEALRANEEEVARVRKEGGVDALEGDDGDEADGEAAEAEQA